VPPRAGQASATPLARTDLNAACEPPSPPPTITVLRRPLESALHAAVAVMD